MSSDITLSFVVAEAMQAAMRLRSENRTYPVIGRRMQTQQVEQRGFLGRVSYVQQEIQVPVLAPGWPLGVSRPLLAQGSGSTSVTEDIMLDSDGRLHTVRIDAGRPEETRSTSTRVLYVLRSVQCSAAQPEWVSTGDGSSGDAAATYSLSSITMTSAEAAGSLVDRLRRM